MLKTGATRCVIPVGRRGTERCNFWSGRSRFWSRSCSITGTATIGDPGTDDGGHTGHIKTRVTGRQATDAFGDTRTTSGL